MQHAIKRRLPEHGFCRTFAAETFAIVKLYIKRVGSLSAACFCDFEFATRLQKEYRNFAP